MYITICINALAVLFAYLSKYREFKYGLKISFLILFVFLSIRFDFGNDYMNYYKDFITLNSYSSINFFDKSLHYEPGWLFLIRVLNPFGFFFLVFLLALFNCIVFYLFIKRYVPVKFYWLAVFLYVFTPGFMLVHASAMRQSIAIGLFVLAIPFIKERNFLKYFLCITIAYFFHSSAIILAPVYLLGYVNNRPDNLSAGVIFSVFILLFLIGDLFLPYINDLIIAYFPGYEIYTSTSTELGSGTGVFLMAVILLFVLFYRKFQNKEIGVLFNIVIIGFMFIPIGLLIAMASRIGMYFTPACIVVYPLIYSKIKSPVKRNIFLSFLMAFTVYSFYVFFNSEVFKKGYENYQTIFS